MMPLRGFSSLPLTAAVAVLVLASLLRVSLSFVSAPSTAPRRAAANRRLQLTIGEVKDPEINEAVEFFVANFWPVEPSAAQTRQLEREQLADWERRYSSYIPRKLPSALLVARENNNILGVIGVQVVPCDGERVGLKYVSRGQNPGYQLRPLLSNLAVARSERRRGLGNKLVKACEAKVKSWGYSEMLLLVSQENEPARSLYRRMGYTDLFTDSKSSRVEVTPVQIRNIQCSNVCMQRNLQGGSGAGGGMADFFQSLFGGR